MTPEQAAESIETLITWITDHAEEMHAADHEGFKLLQQDLNNIFDAIKHIKTDSGLLRSMCRLYNTAFAFISRHPVLDRYVTEQLRFKNRQCQRIEPDLEANHMAVSTLTDEKLSKEVQKVIPQIINTVDSCRKKMDELMKILSDNESNKEQSK